MTKPPGELDILGASAGVLYENVPRTCLKHHEVVDLLQASEKYEVYVQLEPSVSTSTLFSSSLARTISRIRGHESCSKMLPSLASSRSRYHTCCWGVCSHANFLPTKGFDIDQAKTIFAANSGSPNMSICSSSLLPLCPRSGNIAAIFLRLQALQWCLFLSRQTQCIAAPDESPTNGGIHGNKVHADHAGGRNVGSGSGDAAIDPSERTRVGTVRTFALWILAHYTGRPDDRVHVASHGGLKVNRIQSVLDMFCACFCSRRCRRGQVGTCRSSYGSGAFFQNVGVWQCGVCHVRFPGLL